ncbi:MAG: hypothetical protein JWM17_2770 [Actinobacteria bacterium]|nr:hypothetical protein [Actinomycetota bacterium]MCW3043091.1 hypothetical protein [Actinomycetota bacterium]MEA2567342.1 hypothetical protein [Actinomycetota bacterium]MEA2589479.1 hypothetical protein [Actinomycetota bacterium]
MTTSADSLQAPNVADQADTITAPTFLDEALVEVGDPMTDEEMQHFFKRVGVLEEEMKSAGALVFSGPGRRRRYPRGVSGRDLARFRRYQPGKRGLSGAPGLHRRTASRNCGHSSH